MNLSWLVRRSLLDETFHLRSERRPAVDQKGLDHVHIFLDVIWKALIIYNFYHQKRCDDIRQTSADTRFGIPPGVFWRFLVLQVSLFFTYSMFIFWISIYTLRAIHQPPDMVSFSLWVRFGLLKRKVCSYVAELLSGCSAPCVCSERSATHFTSSVTVGAEHKHNQSRPGPAQNGQRVMKEGGAVSREHHRVESVSRVDYRLSRLGDGDRNPLWLVQIRTFSSGPAAGLTSLTKQEPPEFS